jgi:hypothetical protein
VVLSIDGSLVGLGSIVQQNSTAKANAAAAHLSVLRLAAGAAKASRRQH